MRLRRKMNMAIDREDPEVIALIEEVTAALVAKNTELKKEKLALQAKAKNSEIDPVEYAALQSTLEELENKFKVAEAKAKSDIEKLTKLARDKEVSLSEYLVDAELASAITGNGIAAHYVNAVKAMFKPGTSVVEKDGGRSVMLGDKPLADVIKAWAAGDDGKHFISAQNNSGGGAAGNRGATGAKKWNDMSTEERTELYRKDKAAYEAAKAGSAV